ncbi:MAG: right-handed parallel beta-helix repeat-containing protein [Gemmataceae bacterium]|nr:right-handed parallel beta-helix repeat-containing protein [Gemmataceae bacterium]
MRQPTLLVLAGALLALPRTGLLAAPPAAPDPRAVIPASLHVDAANAGAQDGSALRPFRTVQQAIDRAKDGAVIAVARGTYPENVRVRDKAVRLYGGYAGGTKAGYAKGSAGDFKSRDPAANVSHLKGDGKDSVVTLAQAGASVVDGFLVTGGGRSALAKPLWVGGGFYILEGSPTISNNVIEKNRTCPPVKQEQEKLGGGIYSAAAKVTILGNVIRNNVSGRGAGISVDGPKVVIRGNIVQDNIGVSDHGGGLYVFSPDAEISRNRVSGNEIGRDLGYGWGGGIIVFNKGGNYKLSHNVFTGNFAPSVGSAVFVDDGAVASMDHDLVFANACNPKGTGAVPPVYVDGDGGGNGSTLTLDHVTIAGHTCKPTIAGNAITVTDKSKVVIKNSILWNNGGDDLAVDKTSKATVSYTLASKLLKGTGNLSKDPLFADPKGHDYRLRSTGGRWDPTADGKRGAWVKDREHSPAIDAGDPASPFKLEPAPNGDRANLGHDGGTARASKSAR